MRQRFEDQILHQAIAPHDPADVEAVTAYCNAHGAGDILDMLGLLDVEVQASA